MTVELDPSQRVVVTGMGCITPLGFDVESTWQTIVDGKDAMQDIHGSVLKGYAQFETATGAPVLDFNLLDETSGRNLSNIIERKALRRIHLSAQYVLWAADEALRQAGLLNDDGQINPNIVAPERVGIRMGTGVGGAEEFGNVLKTLDSDKKMVPPTAILKILPERVATVPSMVFNIKGPDSTVIAACATGNANIIAAADVLTHRRRRADIMLAGGSDAMLTAPGIALFEGIGAMDKSEDPKQASRPFNTDPAGLGMGEGAGVLVMETLENARRRGAVMLAELVGYAETSDAYDDAQPSGEGSERAMRESLIGNGSSRETTFVLQAHAAGTIGDAIELNAIGNVFNGVEVDGEAYYQDQVVGISSVKSQMGHTLGAHGAIASIVAINTIRDGIVPPSLKLHSPIPEAKGWPMSPHTATKIPRGIGRVVVNTLGLGGVNAVTVWGPPPQ